MKTIERLRVLARKQALALLLLMLFLFGGLVLAVLQTEDPGGIEAKAQKLESLRAAARFNQ